MTIRHCIGVAAALAASLLAATSSGATRAAGTACSPTATILESPRPSTLEVQAKAINDRGDIVGFADSNDGNGPIHAILWKGGKAAGAVDLGVLPGYVSSEAYGVNNDRVVFGVLYDRKERTVPFRWENGHMTVLKGPNGRIRRRRTGCGRQERDQRPRRDAWTMIVARRPAGRALDARRQGDLPSRAARAHLDGRVRHQRRRRRVRLVAQAAERGRRGEPRALDALGQGRPAEDRPGPGRRDRRGDEPSRADRRLPRQPAPTTESRERPVRGLADAHGRAAACSALSGPNLIAELVDVNDRGQAAGMTGTMNPKTGFILGEAVIWRTGLDAAETARRPGGISSCESLRRRGLNDINDGGAIVGNVYGLASKDYASLRRIDPVLWTCAFGPVT